MKKQEIILAVVIAAVALLLSNIYVLYGIFQPKSELVFLGRHVINSQDTYTYVAFIEQARQGRVLFENLYTSESQVPHLFRPSYILLGKFASITQVSSLVTFHIGRIVASCMFFIMLYAFLHLFFHTSKKRLFAFFVILTSSGLGFLAGRFIPDVSDLWIPESITFLSLGEAPHFIFSQFFMIGAFFYFLKNLTTGKKAYVIICAVMLVLLGFEHPFNLGVVAATVFFTGIYFWIKKSFPKKAIVIGVVSVFLASVLGILYQGFEVYQSPVLRSWTAQNVLTSPIPMSFVFGYGILLLFGVIGLEKFLKEKLPQQIVLIVWVGVTFVLLYSPIFFQRRFSEGLHIPIGILAVSGMIFVSYLLGKFVVKRVKRITIYGSAITFAGFVMIGSLVNVYTDISTFSTESKNSYYYHLFSGEVDGMNYLKSETDEHDVILTNWFYGNVLPGITGRKVYVGHRVQTPHFDARVDKINTFLLNEDSDSAYAFLKENNITYIFLGNNDTMLQYGFEPEKKPYLIREYNKNGVSIYRVREL